MATELGENSFIDSVIDSLALAKNENRRLADRKLIDVAFSRIAAENSDSVERSAALMTACCLVSKITLEQLCSRVKRAFCRKSRKDKKQRSVKHATGAKKKNKKKARKTKEERTGESPEGAVLQFGESISLRGGSPVAKSSQK